MRKLSQAILCSLVVAFAASTQAAPLNLDLNDFPDFTANFIDLNYIADNSPNNFTATGFTLELEHDGPPPALSPDAAPYGSFSVSASITTAGALTGGTLAISGDYTSTLGLSGVLLTGDLTAFGFLDGAFGELFEFTYTVTGGLMATSQYFGVLGTHGGVIYDTGENVFNGTFTSNFSTSGFGTGGNADVAPIPEPATLSLILLAGVSLLRPLRRR